METRLSPYSGFLLCWLPAPVGLSVHHAGSTFGSSTRQTHPDESHDREVTQAYALLHVGRLARSNCRLCIGILILFSAGPSSVIVPPCVQGELALTIMGIDGEITPDVMSKLGALSVRIAC